MRAPGCRVFDASAFEGVDSMDITSSMLCRAAAAIALTPLGAHVRHSLVFNERYGSLIYLQHSTGLALSVWFNHAAAERRRARCTAAVHFSADLFQAFLGAITSDILLATRRTKFRRKISQGLARY